VKGGIRAAQESQTNYCLWARPQSEGATSARSISRFERAGRKKAAAANSINVSAKATKGKKDPLSLPVNTLRSGIREQTDGEKEGVVEGYAKLSRLAFLSKHLNGKAP